MNILVPEKKFVVVADSHTHEPLEIFFDDSLPDLHSEIFGAAQKIWKEKGIETVCAGGGRFCIMDNYAVFFGKSQKYHRFENKIVEALSKKHPAFKDKGYKIICDTRYDNPRQLIEIYG